MGIGGDERRWKRKGGRSEGRGGMERKRKGWEGRKGQGQERRTKGLRTI